jgi:intracellular sulfur oxidation DsrE/DsrF family protein
MKAMARAWIKLASLSLMVALASIVSLAPISWAQPVSESESSENPFAEHHLVLQLSDADAKKQGLVISVAYNLLKFYGPDKVAIEVVAFGPGIELLYANSSNRKYVDSLIAQGVRFDICMNTVDTIARTTGKRPELNPKAIPVQAGVAQILALTEKGYTLVRP